MRPGQPSTAAMVGKGLEARALVHEFQLTRIDRVHAQSDAERIENALARAVVDGNVGRPIGHDPFVVQAHGRFPKGANGPNV